jgi:hypothetical protein
MTARVRFVRPTLKGIDIESPGRKLDGHLRLEMVEGDSLFFLDVFRSGIKDPEKAYVETYGGTADEINVALRDNSFRERIRVE